MKMLKMVEVGAMKKQKENMELYSIQISEMCRQKLLRYADSFYALAKSYEKEMLPKVQDRQTRLLEERLGESRRIIRSNMREMANNSCHMVMGFRIDNDHFP